MSDVKKVVEAVSAAMIAAGIAVDRTPLTSRRNPQRIDRFSFQIGGKRYALIVWPLSSKEGPDERT